MYPKHELSTFYIRFQVTSGELSHVRVFSGYVSLRDVISIHVIATSCELQPCRTQTYPKCEFSDFNSRF